MDENQLKCPGCGVSIERAQIELLLKERYDKPELLEKFYQFSLQNTLMQNEKFVSCPGKDCR